MAFVEKNGLGNLLSDMRAAIERKEPIDKYHEHIVAIVERLEERRHTVEQALYAARAALHAAAADIDAAIEGEK